MGGGKIGTAIARRFRACGAKVTVTARSARTVKMLLREGFEASTCNRCAVEEADVIVFAVKPYNIVDVVRDIRGADCRGKIAISVMAGVTLSTLKKLLPNCPLCRAMPNINVEIAESSIALDCKETRYREVVVKLLSCLGTVYEVPEELFDAWTALIGSGPAIIAEFIDALALAGLAVGLPLHVTREAILETVMATAKYLKLNPTTHPSQLRDKVTTPAGTTIKAIKVLEGSSFKAAIIEAVEAATKRGREIARQIELLLTRDTQE